MLQDVTVPTAIVCTGCVGCAGVFNFGGYLLVSFIMMLVMLVLTALDLFFMWRRCNRRKRMISKLQKRRATDGKSNC